jgi:hypothetical protein
VTDDRDEAALLWVARETGVLEALLSTADTPAEAAASAGVPERAGRILGNALADRGFFAVVDGVYEPTDRALGFLARTDPRSVGSLPYRADLLERCAALPAGLAGGSDAGGDAPAEPAAPPTPEPEHWTADRLGAVAATDAAVVRALVTAAVREAPGADRVVDVGGAPGTYAREFADRGFEAALCAQPEAAARSRSFLAATDVAVVERAIPPDSLPDCDLAFVPDLTRRLGPDGNRRLFGALADALAPDGTVVAVDHLRGHTDGAAGAALEALATTAAGEVYGPDRYREWLPAAGFAPAIRSVPGVDRAAVVGRLG